MISFKCTLIISPEEPTCRRCAFLIRILTHLWPAHSCTRVVRLDWYILTQDVRNVSPRFFRHRGRWHLAPNLEIFSCRISSFSTVRELSRRTRKMTLLFLTHDMHGLPEQKENCSANEICVVAGGAIDAKGVFD